MLTAAMRSTPKAALILAIAIVFVSSYSQSQTPTSPAKDRTTKNTENIPSPACNFGEIYKAEGWKIPGLDKVAKERETGNLTNLPGVSLTKLHPLEPEASLEAIFCPYDHRGRLTVEDAKPIRIMALWAFAYSGHIFAYRIEYSDEAIENGQRHELASASSVFFYDVDGSGRFTSLASCCTYLPPR